MEAVESVSSASLTQLPSSFCVWVTHLWSELFKTEPLLLQTNVCYVSHLSAIMTRHPGRSILRRKMPGLSRGCRGFSLWSLDPIVMGLDEAEA